MKFTKMHGAGNDFIVIEDMFELYLNKESVMAKKLCHRHFSIGADGVLFVRKSNIADIQMVIINADGSYATMCGNGIRCFAKYVYESKLINKEIIEIETGDGIKKAYLKVIEGKVHSITINMGSFSFNPKDIPVNSSEEIINKKICIDHKEYKITSVFMGVPHTVVFGRLDDFNILEGSFIENYSMFPEGTNVNFCEIVDEDKIKVKTFERGAGETLACGTGSCATVVIANRLGFIRSNVKVKVPGGTLYVEVVKKQVFMTGSADIIFTGEIDYK
ncbi:diaminopimelate epimerase [Clostridium rectalis]|uniref:diaminopimelate epimerase n=1 Tax=Clostridium rectalis TaxID=2040295 RepID=UPI000F63223E|nr:diaminopimelate epimerase [Clostridium rectalis]